MPTKTIYVPDDLMRRMKALDNPPNWSKIVQKAFTMEFYGEFLELDVKEHHIKQAIEMRNQRSLQYRSNFNEEDRKKTYDGRMDKQAVGDLGEVVFDEYLSKVIGPLDYDWVTEGDVVGKPDFLIADRRIDLKTTEALIPIHNYDCKVEGNQIEHAMDWYVFAFYDSRSKIMVIAGAIRKREFVRLSTFYECGANSFNGRFIVKDPNGFHSVPLRVLTNPTQWLDMAVATSRGDCL